MFVLMLCELDVENKDMGGTVFPSSGFVDANSWKGNNDMSKGLYGAMNGYMPMSWQFSGCDRWAVLSVETNHEFIFLDKANRIAKFRTGALLVSGTLDTCSKFLTKESKNVDYR